MRPGRGAGIRARGILRRPIRGGCILETAIRWLAPPANFLHASGVRYGARLHLPCALW